MKSLLCSTVLALSIGLLALGCESRSDHGYEWGRITGRHEVEEEWLMSLRREDNLTEAEVALDLVREETESCWRDFPK